MEIQLMFDPTKKVEMELVELPLDVLPQNEALMSPPATQAFVQDIYQRGQIDPIIVTKISKKSYFVVAGRRRIKAFRLLAQMQPDDPRFKTIKAEVSNLSDMEAILAMSAENNRRNENPISDLQAIEFVVKNKPNATITEIANLTGIPAPRVKKRLILKKLNPTFTALFNAGDLATATAEGLAKLPLDYQTRLEDLYHKQGHISLEDITDTQRVRVADNTANIPIPDLQVEEENPILGYALFEQTMQILHSTVYPYIGSAEDQILSLNPTDTEQVCVVALMKVTQ